MSATQINAFLHYPRQFERRYLLGLKDPTTGAAALGKAWHKAVEMNYRHKLAAGADLPLAEVQALFSQAFDAIIAKEEVVFKPNEKPAKLKEMGLAITSLYHKTIAPKIKPALIEERFRVGLGEEFPYDLVGVWDLVDDQGIVIDHKAYARAPSQDEVDKNVQLGVYALAYRLINGKPEAGLRLDILVKGRQPQAVQISTRRTNRDCRWLLEVMERMTQVLESGSFDTRRNLHMGGVQ
jgi:hypothetical protein